MIKKLVVVGLLISSLCINSCKKESDHESSENTAWELVEYTYKNDQLEYNWPNVDVDLYKVQFFGNQKILIAGYSHNLYGSGISFSSQNLGMDWQHAISNFESGAITQFSFINDSVGFILDNDISGPNLHKTTNSCKDFNKIEGDAYYAQYGLTFLNDTLGYFGPYRTINGGISWISANELKDHEFYYSKATLPLYCCGEELKISEDNGYTWTSIYNPDSPIQKIQFNDELNGFIQTENSLLKTTDGGNSWKKIHNTVSSFYFTENNQIGFITLGSKIFKSKDGGSTWTTSFESDVFDFLDIDGQGDCIIAVGKQKISKYGGSAYIVRTTNLGEEE